MKIAVTYENGQVFQHFGHTEQFKLYTVENGQITDSQVVDTNGSGHGALATFLKAHGVDTLICGGIGAGAQNALAVHGPRWHRPVSSCTPVSPETQTPVYWRCCPTPCCSTPTRSVLTTTTMAKSITAASITAATVLTVTAENNQPEMESFENVLPAIGAEGRFSLLFHKENRAPVAAEARFSECICSFWIGNASTVGITQSGTDPANTGRPRQQPR